MTENNPEYVNEDEAPKRSKFGFLRTRGFKIAAISAGSALALVGSFGAGVLASDRISGHGPGFAFGDHRDGDGDFGKHGGFGPGNGFGPDRDFGPGHGFGPQGALGDGPDGKFGVPAPTATPGAKS